jgi:PhnB protein
LFLRAADAIAIIQWYAHPEVPMPVAPIPPGYRSITPYLAVDGAAKAIEFYATAFGARERLRMPRPDGRIAHAELEIGDSLVMLADPWPEGHFLPPQGEAVPVSLHLYVPDVDAVAARAVAAGARLERPVETQFYGDRSGTLRDPFGHRWHLATHVEDVSEEEVARRMKRRPTSP